MRHLRLNFINGVKQVSICPKWPSFEKRLTIHSEEVSIKIEPDKFHTDDGSVNHLSLAVTRV